MIRIAKLSYWHVHAWEYTGYANEHPGTEIAAVWDEVPARGQEAADKLGVPYYSDLDELLAQDDIDAVIVDAPTSMHRDVMVKAANAGKHIFTEKVIAPATSELNDILKAVQDAGVKLTVSLPRLNDPYTPAIRNVIAQGLLGQLDASSRPPRSQWLPRELAAAAFLCAGADRRRRYDRSGLPSHVLDALIPRHAGQLDCNLWLRHGP